MPRKMTLEEFKKKLPPDIAIIDSTFRSAIELVTLIDPIYGEWQVKPTKFLSGNRHPQRAINNTIKRCTIPIEFIKTFLPPFLEIDETTYNGSHKRCRFIDKEYGEYWTLPKRLYKGLGLHRKRRKKKSFTDLKLILNKMPKKIKIITKTYKGTGKLAVFLDKDFGYYKALPGDVLKGKGSHPKRSSLNKSLRWQEWAKTGRENEIIKKRKNTLLKKYGVDNPSKKLEFSLKAARSMNSSSIALHWKTSEELVCVGSYEKIVVDYLNEKKINFDWQPAVFQLANDLTFRPDMYLPDYNMWVEIKGFSREDFKIKWQEFIKIQPNSVIWSAKEIKQIKENKHDPIT